MKKCQDIAFPSGSYVAPSVQIRELSFEVSFLVSNTEPIDGWYDPYIEW